jgi:hypothetical protein
MREILGNVTTFIMFTVSHVDAVALHQEFAIAHGGEIAFVPPEEFTMLKTGEACGKIDKSVFPLKTTLAPQQADFTRTKAVIERSRSNYGYSSTLPDARRQKPVPEEEEFPFDTERVF